MVKESNINFKSLKNLESDYGTASRKSNKSKKGSDMDEAELEMNEIIVESNPYRHYIDISDILFDLSELKKTKLLKRVILIIF